MSARYWQQVETGKLELKPGVREMLQFLKEQHIPAAIASSTRRAAVRQQITLFGLQDFFCKIIGGDMVQQSKPHPEIYQTACRVLDVLTRRDLRRGRTPTTAFVPPPVPACTPL